MRRDSGDDNHGTSGGANGLTGWNMQTDCPSGMVCADGLDGGSYSSCAAPQYTASDGMVTDSLTGLVWQQTVAGPRTGGFFWDSTGADPSSGQYYCSHLNLGGHSDWRVPEIAELFSLVDMGMDATIDPVAFPDTPRAAFWSGTPAPPDHAWLVSGGGVRYDNTTGIGCLVRCVR